MLLPLMSATVFLRSASLSGAEHKTWLGLEVAAIPAEHKPYKQFACNALTQGKPQ
jgi:hypothetical protein